jgi:polyhydroxyalkanoate synthase subunit PhaC
MEALIDCGEWLSSQEDNQGSWWPDWVRWMAGRSLPMTTPPLVGSDKYPSLIKAPGNYVLEK